MVDVSRVGLEDRLGAVLHKAAPLLPGNVGRHLLALVAPGSLAIMAGVVVVWAASHFVGVGEIADVALLIGGWLMIGAGAAAGCRKLLSFALGTHSARTEADLDRAARDLADAVAILGVDVALGLLFKGRPKDTLLLLVQRRAAAYATGHRGDATRRSEKSVRVPDHLHS